MAGTCLIGQLSGVADDKCRNLPLLGLNLLQYGEHKDGCLSHP